MLITFSIAGLPDLYADRHLWVPVYLDRHFWAGMKEVQAQFREKANCVTTCKQRVPGFVVYELLRKISSNRKLHMTRYHLRSNASAYYLNLERRHTSIKSNYDEPSLEPRNVNYDDMLYHSKVHCETASGYPVLTRMVHRAYDKLEADMKEYKAKSDVQSILTHEDGSLSEMNDLQTPTCVRSRGRRKKRLGSIMEKILHQS
ncbi:hypothetical protein PIB30_071488 [Stylosanthes scabra]|uniref:Protein FAR1-RELATED SEQUENCE n=1 Tax=Stylosanthes scabra TaxID=79078 RepID=A0ABU6ZMK5_9FABA|nr:hypothetical protein [Stylosanthes scabra]